MSQRCCFCQSEFEFKEITGQDLDDCPVAQCPQCGGDNRKEGWEMGKLADRAREKSPFVKLEIGEETPVLIYKSWKETTDNFGNETFRYFFDLTTENGIILKQLDNRSQAFAETMDKVEFGKKVVLSREPKLDHEGEPIENKSVWRVRVVE